MWHCQRVSRSWRAKVREYNASLQAKKRTTGPATQGDHSQNRSLHGLFQDDILIDHLMCRARWNLEHFTPDTKRCESPRSATVLAKRAGHCRCRSQQRGFWTWHHRLRMLVDHLMCRDGRSEESLLERRAVKTRETELSNRSWVAPQVCTEDFEIDGTLVAYLLAAVMDRWLSFTRLGSRKLPRFHRCVQERRQLTLSRTRRVPAPVWEGTATRLSYGSVHSQLAGDVHASVKASGIEKEGSCPTACATSPMLVGLDRRFRNWSVYQRTGIRSTSSCSPAQDGTLQQQRCSRLQPTLWNSAA